MLTYWSDLANLQSLTFWSKTVLNNLIYSKANWRLSVIFSWCSNLPTVLNWSGLHAQYWVANASIIRSIFCASPGKRKLQRKSLWNKIIIWTRFYALDFINNINIQDIISSFSYKQATMDLKFHSYKDPNFDKQLFVLSSITTWKIFKHKQNFFKINRQEGRTNSIT